nr:MAG TPA: hypothetical protein [Caudoviricetes sp.]
MKNGFVPSTTEKSTAAYASMSLILGTTAFA